MTSPTSATSPVTNTLFTHSQTPYSPGTNQASNAHNPFLRDSEYENPQPLDHFLFDLEIKNPQTTANTTSPLAAVYSVPTPQPNLGKKGTVLLSGFTVGSIAGFATAGGISIASLKLNLLSAALSNPACWGILGGALLLASLTIIVLMSTTHESNRQELLSYLSNGVLYGALVGTLSTGITAAILSGASASTKHKVATVFASAIIGALPLAIKNIYSHFSDAQKHRDYRLYEQTSGNCATVM